MMEKGINDAAPMRIEIEMLGVTRENTLRILLDSGGVLDFDHAETQRIKKFLTSAISERDVWIGVDLANGPEYVTNPCGKQ